jgi:hypothetical protein
MDSECKETLAASLTAVKPDGPLGKMDVEEVAPEGPPQESSTRLSLTPDPEKGEPPVLGPESPGGDPQPPELSGDKGVTSSAGPCEVPLGTEADSAGAAFRPSQCSRYVTEHKATTCFFQGWQLTLTSLLFHSLMYLFINSHYVQGCGGAQSRQMWVPESGEGETNKMYLQITKVT